MERWEYKIGVQRQDLRREIDKLERNQGLNEVTIDYVCNFMTKPAKLWKDANLETRQVFQKMLFPNGLHFDIKEKIFGTDDLNPLFSVIRNKKESCDGSNSEMVISARVELALTGWKPVVLTVILRDRIYIIAKIVKIRKSNGSRHGS